ncbi:MAG: dynamin family protein [Lachnospiraceae bacterium]|nr:dynamin family protein [Lachnospiraceae bacterium]
MVNRGAYDEIIGKMKEIISHHSGDDFANGISKIEEIKNDFDIKLMFVGHFSAGKSSLLNVLMGKTEFLKEAQEPQTAIATELIYDEDESAFAYDINGKSEILNINKEYLPNQYNHIEYRLNNLALKEISDFTIVDTPGFDAGIEAHAKALANYIGVGSAYIVVVDQEKGGIDQTTLDFIQEISNYSRQIAILINKCDKITADVAESIAESARFTLSTHGLPYKVYTISKKDNDISNKLISIISEFDAQMAFDRALIRQIKSELVNIEKVLSLTKKKIYLDTFDLDSDIEMYTRLEEQLAGTINKKREEAIEDIDNTVQEVTHQIRSALISRSDSVAEALLSGNQVAAEAIIVETIRPIMLATMKNISIRQVDSVADAIDFTGLISESEEIDLTDVAVNLAGNLKDLIEQGTLETKTITDVESADKKKNIYRAITGIAAIATDVIAPWLEVVIILLPDIINLLQGIFGESDTELAKRRFVNNVVPQIINKIYPQVKDNVESTTKLVLEEYEKMLNGKIETLKSNLTEAQNKKIRKTEDFEKYKDTISDDIEIARKLIFELG